MIEIKHRFTNTVLFSLEVSTVKEALVEAIKKDADLMYANLRGADLRGADLSGADLRGADLRGADLSGADLMYANLRVADLSGADLSGADLSGADLSGADLSGEDLRNAKLSGEKLAISPIFIKGLIWNITITERWLTIGCQRHEHSAWKNFNDDEISKMELRALEFWKANKSWLLSACKAHRKDSITAKKGESK